ncbi:hypothetical protein BH11BAC3_BH11BAC3_10230 [soil metagenome]
MTNFERLKEGGKKYLLIPVMPTPNGGLHLGHLAGPFLKMDVLARAQRRMGNEVATFFGSDGYESYMNLKSWQTGKGVTELCNEFHERMRSDLDALSIEYDAFINPLDPIYNADFKSFITNVVKDLVAKGVVEIRPEKYLYSKDEDCYLAGCWILGDCPVCGSGSGSYQCEDCGTQYRPMDLKSPAFRRGDFPLTSVEDKDLYLVINKKEELFQHLEAMQAGPEFIEIAKTYFNHQGNYIRLSNPGKWGIPWEIEDSKIPHVLFTYSALYFYSLFCGELYKKKFNTALNPLDKNSEVVTVASFGIDCTIPYMVASVALGLEGDQYRPIDYLSPNHFYTLENAKFSTSRGHAIWGDDIVNKTPVNADAVRYFLVLFNPENAMSDFSVEAFLKFVNDDLANELQPLLEKAWGSLDEQLLSEPDETFIKKLEDILIAQQESLTPPGFQLKASSDPLKDWIGYGKQHSFENNSAYWWLKGFALLAFPIMPGCAMSIWNLLGQEGNPLVSAFFLQSQPNRNSKLPAYFKSINFDELKPALPATLFTNELK